MQTTLKRETTLVGTGLHSGRPARIVLRPATEGGIRFRRVDVTDRDNLIPARWDLVSDTRLCTLLTQRRRRVGRHGRAPDGGAGRHRRDPCSRSTSTAPEVPIMDGSALRFVRAILRGRPRAGARPAAGDPDAASRSATCRATWWPSWRRRTR